MAAETLIIAQPEKMQSKYQQQENFFKLIGLFIVFVMLGGFFLWASFAPLKSAVAALGQITVETRNKVVDHFEGGIVTNIYVKDGQSVKKGDLLLDLLDVTIQSQLALANTQYYESIVNIDRLEAELAQKDQLDWSKGVLELATIPEMAKLMREVEALFNSRNQVHKLSIELLRDQINQARTQIDGYKNVVKSMSQQITNLQQDILEVKNLYARKLVDKLRLRDLEESLEEYQTQVIIYKTDQLKFQQQIIGLQNQIRYTQDDYKKTLLEDLRNYQLKGSDALSKLTILKDQAKRSRIYAPDDGTIVGFDVVTIGAVIAPGQKIMQIVPQIQQYVLIGQVAPQDIDQVMPGQQVEIKFTAFNTNYMPVLYGAVETLSADVQVDPATQVAMYKVVIRINQDSLDLLSQTGWVLKAGMPAEAYIQTQMRTLVSYIVKPFRLMLARAFNEDDGK